MLGQLLAFLFIPAGIFGLRKGRVVGPLVDQSPLADENSYYMEPFTQRQVCKSLLAHFLKPCLPSQTHQIITLLPKLNRLHIRSYGC